MPGTRYSVFNPEGESFVPEQDRFNAQLQQAAMSNMAGLAGIQERAREFNIGDQTNRWNAQAEYGLGNKRLDMQSHQFDVGNDLTRQLALAQLGYQNKSLDAQYEGPRQMMAMQKQHWDEEAPARQSALALTQAQLARQKRGNEYLDSVGDTGEIDPVRGIMASGGDAATAIATQQALLRDQAEPLLKSADRDIATNTPAARKHLEGLQAQLKAMKWKGVPQGENVERTFDEWSSDPSFAAPAADLNNKVTSYINRADRMTGDPDVGPERGEILHDVDLMRQAAIKQGYSVAEANRRALVALQSVLAPKQQGHLWGTRTPWNADKIDALATQLGFGPQIGSGAPAAPSGPAPDTTGLQVY